MSSYYTLRGWNDFSVSLTLDKDIFLTQAEADDLNEMVDELVCQHIVWDDDVEVEDRNGFTEGVNSADYEYEFDYRARVTGHGTYDPPVYYLSNGDPGYPEEYDDEWDDLPDKIDTKSILEALKKQNVKVVGKTNRKYKRSLPIADMTYYISDEIDDEEIDWD